MTLRGSSFGGTTAVTFGGVQAPYLVESATTIIAAVPGSATATSVAVRVATPSGISASTIDTRYTYVARPTVTAVMPAAGPVAGGNRVVIRGTGFKSADRVLFGDARASFSVLSGTKIEATAPRGTGSVLVRVRNAGGWDPSVAALAYRYMRPPVVTGLSPGSGAEAGGVEVLITGRRLGAATRVAFGGAAATSFQVLSATAVSAIAPPGSAGSKFVRVTTPGGRSDPVPESAYEYVAATPAPAITSVTPDSGSTSGGNQVTITGTDFDDLIEVRFGFSPALVMNASPEEVRVLAPAGSAGPVEVVVVTGAGTSEPAQYTYITPPQLPVVSSVTPAEGPLAGGTSVVVGGAYFNDVTGVTFGGIASQDWTVVSSTEIHAVSPPGEDANVLLHVVVQTAAGSSAMHLDSEWVYR